MKFLHLADLHLGKRVNGFDMLEDQRFILDQILTLCDKHGAEAVVLAGDIYDTPVPPAAACTLLDWFLTQLATRKIPVLAVSGNHDSAERLDFASGLLAEQGVYIAGRFTGAPRQVVLHDRHGAIEFTLLPFVRAATVRHYLPDADITDYDSAVGAALAVCEPAAPRRVLVAHQMVVSGAGDIQIDVLVNKLKSRFGVEVVLDTPRVPYREKIRKTVSKQGRHKKQTGGSGQFGDVWIRFEPNEESEEMVFAEEVFGGSVPKNFFPAVEKGLREACVHGPLAGYPVVNLKAVLYDGSYHPVDSSEIAFKTAANLAYKAAMPEASPVLLEPVCELKVTVPDQYMGDILGDLNKRRGRVMGMTPTGNGEQVIEAECPEAELMSYAIDLRSMTQSRGSFVMHFVRYEQCSADAQAKAVAAAKAMQEAE